MPFKFNWAPLQHGRVGRANEAASVVKHIAKINGRDDAATRAVIDAELLPVGNGGRGGGGRGGGESRSTRGRRSDVGGETTKMTTTTTRPGWDVVLTRLKNPAALRLAAFWFCANVASGLTSWYPAVTRGVGGGRDEEFGGSLAANLVGVFAFVLTAFHLVKKFGYVLLLTRACVACAVAACTMAAAVSAVSADAPGGGGVWFLVLTYVAWTFAFDVVWPTSYAVAPLLFDPAERSTGFGFAQAVGKLGMTASPWVRLAAGDGGISASGGALLFVVFGLFWILAAIAARRLALKGTNTEMLAAAKDHADDEGSILTATAARAHDEESAVVRVGGRRFRGSENASYG